MNKDTQKIFDLIQDNKEYINNIFCYSDITKRYIKNGFKDILAEEFQIKEINWLYLTNINNISIIGLQNNDNKIYSILDGELYEVCENLSDLPYELLRIKCGDETDNELVEEVFEISPQFRKNLEEYENWCKSNNIVLDKNNIYHDRNGKLFEKYFDKQ